MSSQPVILRTNLADSRNARALRETQVTSDLVQLDFCGPRQAHEGFKPMIRDRAFDAGEMALATFLLAKEFDKPLMLLPAVMSGRFQHGVTGYDANREYLAPKDLEGRRVAVRSYTQTTGLWARGILASEYGVDMSKVTWLCTEGAHVDEYREPANVARLSPDADIGKLLLAGEVDAVMMGTAELAKLPGVKPIIPDPSTAEQAWYEREGFVPVNHLFVIDSDLAQSRPDMVREVWRMLLESKRLAGTSNAIDTMPFGFEENRKAIAAAVDMALDQKIISRRFSVDELYADAAAILGA